MKKLTCLMLAASGLALVCLARQHSDRWTVREEDTIEKTLTLAGQPMRLIVDNLDGYVHVTGTNGPQVHVTAHRIIRAETQPDADQAKNEVKLEMTEQPGSVSIEYKAPWRCNGNCNGCCDSHKHFYEVTYDIDVQAPRNARVVLSTVNGPLRAEQIDGDFDVHTVNGGVKMSGLGGAGDVRAVNGPLTLQFAKNPTAACSFKTVNGTIQTEFQPGLSADLSFKTFNGQIYSDFDVTALPTPAGDTERKNGMFVYRSNSRLHEARTGHGGPKLSFETLNGGIQLHEEQH